MKKTLKSTLLGGLGLSVLATASVGANGTDLPFAIHDIIVTHHTQSISITVRNVSNSTNPADRELRVISGEEEIVNMRGQVWCNSYDHAETAALQAHGLVRHVEMVSLPGGGTGPFTFAMGGGELPDHTQVFNGTNTLENFDFDMPVPIAQDWDSEALINIGWFNAVREVEERLETYLENNAGTAADFLRQDDVFEVQLPMSAVGWCNYDSGNLDNDYAGARFITVTARIFYQGDEDIQNVIGTVAGGSGEIAAPVPNRARETTSTRGPSSVPPARDTRPARARTETTDQDRASDDDNEAALLLPAVQRAREASRRSHSGNEKPAFASDKQQAGRGRTRQRAQVDTLYASTASEVETTQSGDDETEAAVSPTSLILPAVQRATAMSGGAGNDTFHLGSGDLADDGLEPDEIDNSIAEDPQASPMDALLIINRVAGVEPDEID